MSLSLLAPLALLGGLLVGVPILLHLIDRRRVPRIAFPPMRFLLAAQKRLKRRRRVRDPWLLLLRVLALLALILAFSSPLLQYQSRVPAGADLAQNVVFLLDASLSMQARVDEKSLFERAVERIGEVTRRLPEGGRVGLIVFKKDAEDVIGGLTPDLGRLAAALKQVKPSYEETSLRPAVLAGLRVLLSSPEGRGDLYLLSDNTAASLQGAEPLVLPETLEGRIRLVVTQLQVGMPANRSLMGVSVSRDGGEGGKVKISARVRAQGAGLAAEAPLDLSLGGQAISRGFVAGGEGAQEKVFNLPPQSDPSGEGVLVLGEDGLNADNAWYFRLNSRKDLRALIIDGDPGEHLTNAESYFLERALNPRKSSGSRVVPEVVGEGAVSRLSPEQFPVVFLLNVADPSSLAARLEAYVKAGGGLFIAPGSRSRIELYNRRLSELLPASLGEVKAASVDLTGEKPPGLSWPEVSHPIFQVFRDAGATVFGQIAFYKLLLTAPTLKPGATVLLKYTSGLPALLSRTVGAGRVLLFTSSLDHDWSDFPMKSVYLPFVQECTHFLARNPTGEDRARLFTVGQPVTLELPAGSSLLSVVRPDGQQVALEALPGDDVSGGRRAVFRQALVPGHYTVIETAGAEGASPGSGADRSASSPLLRPELSFSVNVSELESDLTPMAQGLLSKVLSGLPVLLEGQGDVEGEVVVDRRRVLNHSLLWAFLGLLALEGMLAAVRSRAIEEPGSAVGEA